jgi:hypothetical protein
MAFRKKTLWTSPAATLAALMTVQLVRFRMGG